VALILALGPVSGAHLNPAVTLAAALERALPWHEAAAYMAVQIAAAFAGVAAAHLMFGEPLFFASLKERPGPSQWWSEAVATFGLVVVITGCVRARPSAVAYAVGGYITAAYWFTASTSFANPAVTLARAASDTFAGIRPVDAPAFIAAQFASTLLAVAVMRWMGGKPFPATSDARSPTDPPG
jgi:glycerol uptake facilitator-like aquaporin